MEEPPLVKEMTIDVRLDSYRSFFDHAWAASMMTRANGTPVYPFIFDLCVAWRGIANTFALPFITVGMFTAFSKGLSKAHEPFGNQLLRLTSETLIGRMGDSLNSTKRKKLQSILSDIYQKTKSAVDNHELDIDRDKLWDNLLDKYEMQVAVWGSQRLAYGALYYSYEDFLIRCVKLQFKVNKYRIKRGEKANEDFARAFGDEGCRYCWQDRDVQIARETRNCLVHNGGRQTDALKDLEPDIQVGDDLELHLMAPHVRDLHELLKNRVTYLIRVMLREEN